MEELMDEGQATTSGNRCDHYAAPIVNLIIVGDVYDSVVKALKEKLDMLLESQPDPRP